MARRPPTAAQPSAPLLQTQRKQEKRERDARRGSSTQRGYGSDWRQLRERFIHQHPLCLFCEEAGHVVAAEVVDHIVSFTDRPELRLDWGNLRSLCKDCHDRRTARDQAFDGRASRWPAWLRPSAIPLHIVCGPAASGKTTYVRERATPLDLVLDLDAIASDLSGLRPHSWGSEWLDPALRYRNELLGRLSRPSDRPAAWLIVSEPLVIRRQWWATTMKPASITVLETDPSICRDRIRSDPERMERRDVWDAAVTRWWSRYERRPGDVVVSLQP